MFLSREEVVKLTPGDQEIFMTFSLLFSFSYFIFLLMILCSAD